MPGSFPGPNHKPHPGGARKIFPGDSGHGVSIATGSQIESYRVSYSYHDLLDKASRDTIRQVANSLLSKPSGMRPSEQVALKWSAVDDRFIHVELSRLKNLGKAELKTAASNRRIEIRPSMKKTLEEQKKQTEGFQTPYVFLNTAGRPILQDKLRELGAGLSEGASFFTGGCMNPATPLLPGHWRQGSHRSGWLGPWDT